MEHGRPAGKVLAVASGKGGVGKSTIERRGLKIMSAGFLLGERQIMPWQSQTLPFVLRQLLYGVAWGSPDYLLIDLPPGTADLQVEVFREQHLDAALLVVGPQDVAHLDAKKVVTLLREANVPVLGAVENMATARCPHCGERIQLFPPVAADRSLWNDGVRRLASLPLDPALAQLNGGPPPAFDALADEIERALA